MKTISSSPPRTGASVLTALLVTSMLFMPVASRADWHSHGSIHRSASVSAGGWRGGGHIDVNRSFNRDVDVHRDIDVHRDWDVHRDIDIDVHNHDHFWGGVAVGAATTLAVGAVVHALPPTHTTVVVANQPYTYSSGVFYQPAPQGGGFVTVVAPVGAIVPVLPPGSSVVAVGGQAMFYFNGTFYQQTGTTFTVVPTPIGAIVPNLPPGATASIINGQTYFLFQGIYYQPVMQNGVTMYTTVKI